MKPALLAKSFLYWPLKSYAEALILIWMHANRPEASSLKLYVLIWSFLEAFLTYQKQRWSSMNYPEANLKVQYSLEPGSFLCILLTWSFDSDLYLHSLLTWSQPEALILNWTSPISLCICWPEPSQFVYAFIDLWQAWSFDTVLNLAVSFVHAISDLKPVGSFDTEVDLSDLFILH